MSSRENMDLHGKNFIGAELRFGRGGTYRGVDAASGKELEPPFGEATDADVDAAGRLAAEAFEEYRRNSTGERAKFLRAIGSGIEALGEELVDRANRETALGVERLRGERGRTVAQLRMFADLIEKGSWVDARIDRTNPDRKPVPKPDVRRMKVPIGPVAVFGASNFPLAFSAAGGDTASALAAGCTVVVKAHPAHPGTSEMVAGAIAKAAREADVPPGVFSMLHGRKPELSLALVRHPSIEAVGFTGSLKAGRALFDAAAARPRPIPVHAEMGSLNPLFLLPGAAAERGRLIAEGLRQSVTLGVGQFCTKPGVVVAMDDEASRRFVATASELWQAAPPGTMLHAGIRGAFVEGARRLGEVAGVTTAAAAPAGSQATPTLFVTDAATFEKHEHLREELFGPATLVVLSPDRDQMLGIARQLSGHLTATIHGTEEDLRRFPDLIDVLQSKVGRLVFNGFPTGVEVCQSMHHGGPYPATTDVRFTSVGTAAIERWVRPVCYQNFPQDALPEELQDANPRHIWRLVDGQWTR